MKITLDLAELVARGKLTNEEAARLKTLAASETGSVAANVFIAFGIISVALGIGFFVPTAATAVVVGALLAGFGLALSLARAEAWLLLARICLTIGTLIFGGGLIYLADGAVWAVVLLAVGAAGASVLARSGLLAAISILLVASALGSGAGYWHAFYAIVVPQPGLNVFVFSILALLLFLASQRLPPAYERLAIIGSRTAVLMVNVAFLVGSLFGNQNPPIDALVFTIGWAVALIGVGIWGAWANRRWVVNVAAVFGAIHFYTQWFETLGANPLSVLGGGVLLVGFGMALWAFNRRNQQTAPPSPIAAG